MASRSLPSLSEEELFGAQERINLNIRRAFDMVLSSKGMQRPRLTEESRFVGLEFTLQFYETVRAPVLPRYPGGSQRGSSADTSNDDSGEADGRKDATGRPDSFGAGGGSGDESSLDLLGPDFAEFVEATLGFFKRDGYLNAEIADEMQHLAEAGDEECLRHFRAFFSDEIIRQDLLDHLVQLYSRRLLQQKATSPSTAQQKPAGRLHSSTTLTFFKDARFQPTARD